MKNKEKLLVMLPTRMRPEGLKMALESYEKNCTEYSDIVFGFQMSDDKLQANRQIVEPKYGKKSYWIYGNIGLCNKINSLSEQYSGYGAYMILNDDQIIHTPEFDKKMMNKLDELEKKNGHRLWILHWKDGINDQRLCQSFATHEWMKIMGSYYPYGYMRQLYSDNMYHFVGEHCGILNYMPDIYIEHRHICAGKATNDKNYLETQTKEKYRQEAQQYMRWLQEKGYDTCSKIIDRTVKDHKKRQEMKLEANIQIYMILRNTRIQFTN